GAAGILAPMVGAGWLAGDSLSAASVAAVILLFLAVARARRATPPRRVSPARSLGFRLGVAWLHVTQPLARLTGRLLSHRSARRETLFDPSLLPGPPVRSRRGMMLFPFDGDRRATVGALLSYI